MQRHILIAMLLLIVLPFTAGHKGGHDYTVNTTATDEHTEAAPAPVGHAAAVDRTTAIISAVVVLLTLSVAVFGIHRYARTRSA